MFDSAAGVPAWPRTVDAGRGSWNQSSRRSSESLALHRAPLRVAAPVPDQPADAPERGQLAIADALERAEHEQHQAVAQTAVAAERPLLERERERRQHEA